MDKNNLLLAGKIVGAHGIKGGLKVISFLERPENFKTYKDFYLGGEKIELDVNFINKNIVVANINKIKKREEAEQLIGREIFINKSELAELKEDEFYYSDLIGLKVVDSNSGKELGKITSVDNFGAGDLFEIKFNDKEKKQKLFAFTKQAFPKINIKEGFIEANLPIEDFAPEEDGDDETNA